MNFIILTLALAVATGSQAAVLRDAPSPPSKTAALFEAIDEFLEDAEKAMDKKWDLVANSKTGKALSDFLDEDDDSTTTPEEQSIVNDLTGFVDNAIDIVEKTFDFASKVDNVSKPIMKKLDAALAQLISPYLDPIIEMAEPYKERLHHYMEKLKELDHHLEEKLKARLEYLDSQVPEKVQKLQEAMSAKKQATK
ncbi:hypothetical protein JRQ81_011493 [Phrynocephalus forsythii]|uniref:Uncharacterized protein n=1 Tax=Phrynocephalus forsythii TaxID=171643 RepID=A0A9Q0X611_9SAUR|nr:hypothetical protein JRQ81_011493 [Phrynocephalus forsythii]